MISPLLEAGKKNKYGQYFTPKLIADFMISLASVDSDAQVLEPACGEGVFLHAIQQKGLKNLTAFEIDPALATAYDFVRYESFVSATIDQKFDLVIGNPPYIRWKNLEPELKLELAQNHLWKQYFNSLCDYLHIFILKSIELLKEGGQLIFICPEYWMNTTHSASLRHYMMTHGYFEQIFHFNETPIFNQAKVSTVIFKYIKSTSQRCPSIAVTKYYDNQVITLETVAALQQDAPSQTKIEKFKVKQFTPDERWLLAKESEIQLLYKFEKACQIPGQSRYATIGDICDIGNGMVSGLDKAFQWNGQTLNTAEQQAMMEVVKARDLRPFVFEKTTSYIFANEVVSEKELQQNHPHFYQHLLPFREKLEKRYQYNRIIPFWHWVFLRNYKLFSTAKPRIFVPCKERISNKNYFRFSLASAGLFPTQDVTALFLKEEVRENLAYLLAFLNNPRVFNWLKYKGIVKGSIVEFSEKPLSSIPFRQIDWSNEWEVDLHNQITQLTQQYIAQPDHILLPKIESLFDQLLS